MQRKAIIIGATGQVGQALTRELCSFYDTVIVIARTMPKYMSKNMHVYTMADFENLNETLSAIAIDDKTDAFCCLWTTKELGENMLHKVHYDYPKQFAVLCHQKGVRRLFLLSKAGVNRHSDNLVLQLGGRLHFELAQQKWQTLAVFLVDSIVVADHDYSIYGLGQRVAQFVNKILPKDKPLTPTQIGMAMTLLAFYAHHQERTTVQNAPNDPSNTLATKIQYISHKQMLSMATVGL